MIDDNEGLYISWTPDQEVFFAYLRNVLGCKFVRVGKRIMEHVSTGYDSGSDRQRYSSPHKAYVFRDRRASFELVNIGGGSYLLFSDDNEADLAGIQKKIGRERILSKKIIRDRFEFSVLRKALAECFGDFQWIPDEPSEGSNIESVTGRDAELTEIDATLIHRSDDKVNIDVTVYMRLANLPAKDAFERHPVLSRVKACCKSIGLDEFSFWPLP